MLGFDPFYNQTIRNILLTFGTIFKDIEMIKYDKDNRAELGRITVPIEYGGKETWLQRLQADPDLTRGVQIKLPAMSYEMVTLEQDRQKQMTSFFNNSNQQSSSTGKASRFKFAVPYNMGINLNLYVRNMEDGTQIVEQILPFFTPDYTVSMKYVDVNGCSIVNDVPFILNGISFNNMYEGAAGDVRMITWTLNFIAEVLFYGPVETNAAMIKEVIVNLRNFDSSNTLTTIDVTPNPLSANSTDANLAYTTTITDRLGP